MANVGDANFMMMDPEQSIPATKVELTVSARKILDLDVITQSDPVCVLFMKALGSNEYREYGRSEVIMNTLNPDFVKKFTMDYFFEEVQHLKFELYDVDSKSHDLKKHDFLGKMECTMGEIMGSGGRLTRPLKGPRKDCGKIIVRGEEMSQCRDLMTLHFKGEHLDKKDVFGKSDPFLLFYRSNEDGTFTVCHKTEVIKKTLDPVWKPFSVMLRSFCNGDYDRTLKVECYDWDRDGGHDLIGVFETTVRELSRGPGHSNVYHLIHPKKQKKKKNYKNSGLIFLTAAKIEPQFTFLDYIQGGCQLNFTVAIDFTASNGDPRTPNSLHYMNPYQPNHYLRALRAVGTVIQDYDADKLFPALGFGARLPPAGVVSHEFFLNGSQDNPYCAGIEGVIDAYQKALHTVQLYGPTNFAPIINHVARFAAAKRDGSEYFILLIITDGIITDMEKTKQAIVNAATLPLSIIIVGVGKEDFSKMEELDGDDVRLSFQGRQAARDIVQFVPFRDFENSDNIVMSQAQLAKEVLAEIPDQLVSYMKSAKIHPKPRRASIASTMSSVSASAPQHGY
ncbi:copine-8-like isoform X2 [Lytechinus variegatus]|uniref:copine-8-like isoform X2 n=1 Tax=Lytechinus variegatus TaxID=7654 RepID=UPI001BB1C595|nr:copine-8-like isoform X2 [Lytechinus variegatus]XP_041453954.1 copine-8-like isoform X2 [Lytechinus variegatus]XP_041453955.1 copine-8-like isoform X2 [Lytechinus variegatus]